MPRLELILLPSASAGGYNAQRLLIDAATGASRPQGVCPVWGAVLDQQGVRLETAIGRASPLSEAGALRPGLGPASSKTGPRRFRGRFFVVVYDMFLASSQELTHAGPGNLSPCSCFTGVSVKRKLTLSLVLIVNQRLVTFEPCLATKDIALPEQ